MHLGNAASDEYWRSIAGHSSTRHSTAPWRVQQHVAALVGDNEISASAVHFQTGDDLSAWTVQIITADGRFAMVRIEFEDGRYDLEEDQRPIRKHQPVQSMVTEAWTRRLRDATTLDLLTVRSALNAFQEPVRDRVDVGGLSLTFNDGTPITLLADQTAMYDHDEKTRADAFLAAVRTHTGL
jgi:hypothetical protein